MGLLIIGCMAASTGRLNEGQPHCVFLFAAWYRLSCLAERHLAFGYH